MDGTPTTSSSKIVKTVFAIEKCIPSEKQTCKSEEEITQKVENLTVRIIYLNSNFDAQDPDLPIVSYYDGTIFLSLDPNEERYIHMQFEHQQGTLRDDYTGLLSYFEDPETVNFYELSKM